MDLDSEPKVEVIYLCDEYELTADITDFKQRFLRGIRFCHQIYVLRHISLCYGGFSWNVFIFFVFLLF